MYARYPIILLGLLVQCKKPPKHMRSWFLDKPPTPAHPNGGTIDASLLNFSVPLSGGF